MFDFFFLAFLLLRVNGKGGQDLMVQSSHGSRRAYFTQMQVGQKCAFRTHLLAFILWNRCAVIWLKNRKRRMCVCVWEGRRKESLKKKNRVNFVWIVLLTQQSQVKASFTFLLRSSAVTSEHTSKCLCVSEVTVLPPIWIIFHNSWAVSCGIVPALTAWFFIFLLFFFCAASFWPSPCFCHPRAALYFLFNTQQLFEKQFIPKGFCLFSLFFPPPHDGKSLIIREEEW